MTKKYEDYTREQLLEEIKKLKKQKKFGLVWEDKPEQVVEDCKNNFPVLTEVSDKAISEAENSPTHLIIEGDNFHSLSVLNVTHKGKIDVIYIDPPYNTGNKDFKYNDHFVDKEDSFRHSKWLSFMEKRLKLAKELLSETGVIFISIDDNEINQLKLLCDEIYAEKNFIAKMIWQQGKKSSGNLIGINHEYIIVYANNRELIDNPISSWKQKKQGLEKIYNKFEKLKKEYKDDLKTIEKEIKKWFNSLSENDPAFNSKHYSLVDEIGLFFADNSCAPDRPETRCHKKLIHPITLKETAVPKLGWRWKEATLDKMVENNLIYFGENENVVPKVKKYLKDMEYELPYSVFYKDGRGASAELELILGLKKFNNPKDRIEISRLLNFRKNSTILDFFAGSGTTGHAVLELNKEDGGNRQFILCTNNENGICEEVTYPRIKTVITGKRTDGTNYSDGIPANLRYFKTDFIEKSEDTDENRISLTKRCYELLQIKESCYESQKSNIESLKIWRSNNKLLAVIFDRYDKTNDQKYISEITGFARNSDDVVVYRFSIDGNLDMNISALKNARLEEIPEEILKTFNQIFKPKKKRK